ncbi:hypothetical protein O6H91_12G070100 [Diphasiastrum complanatum]|uniref:Uncharacterized protein n=1 Tax=Diphasiastrum complanatum TaxID=34168 RepID=A0ACC2C3P1_DIPCM|nr:hypothetical protein O6H91_12G070100 [Diphasiastrum complanatum]
MASQYVFPNSFPPPPTGSVPFSNEMNFHSSLKIALFVAAALSAFALLTVFGFFIRIQCVLMRTRNRRLEQQRTADRVVGAFLGLQKEVVNQFPLLRFSDSEKWKMTGIRSMDCSVCLTEFQVGENVRLLPQCRHGFHSDCINMWFFSHKTCPICRISLVPDPQVISLTSALAETQVPVQASGELGHTQVEIVEVLRESNTEDGKVSETGGSSSNRTLALEKFDSMESDHQSSGNTFKDSYIDAENPVGLVGSGSYTCIPDVLRSESRDDAPDNMQEQAWLNPSHQNECDAEKSEPELLFVDVSTNSACEQNCMEAGTRRQEQMLMMLGLQAIELLGDGKEKPHQAALYDASSLSH